MGLYYPEDLAGYGAEGIPDSAIAPPPSNLIPLPQVHPNPTAHAAAVAHLMGMRAAILRYVQHHHQRTARPMGEEPGATPSGHQPAEDVSPPNATAKALKAAGSIFNELAKHHEHGAKPKPQHQNAARQSTRPPIHHPEPPITYEQLLEALHRR